MLSVLTRHETAPRVTTETRMCITYRQEEGKLKVNLFNRLCSVCSTYDIQGLDRNFSSQFVGDDVVWDGSYAPKVYLGGFSTCDRGLSTIKENMGKSSFIVS